MSIQPVVQKIDRRTKAGRAMAAQQQIANDAAEATAAPSRMAPRSQVREPGRDTMRAPTRGRGVVTGRNGEQLSRHRTGGADPFHIPPEIVPAGWSYQWNVVSVIGNQDIVLDQSNGMYENGWRPVPAERHPGVFLKRGTTGEIVRGGQRLEERPTELSNEAQAEDIRTAKRLVSDRNESLKLAGVKTAMPDGFEMKRQYRGTGGDIRLSIDRGLDIPTPSHTLAEPGE